MAKRNPNHYGSVSKLSGNRSRPWVVRATVYDSEGKAHQKPVGYAATKPEALMLLAKYNHTPWEVHRETVTLSDLYERWLEAKAPLLSKGNRTALVAAYKHCSKYYGMKYMNLKSYHMQDCVNSCPAGYSTKNHIKTLFNHLDRFALELDIIDRSYSGLVESVPVAETTRTPFTREQIDALWKISDKPYVDTVLVMLYSGFRVNELLTMRKDQVDLAEMCFKGGIKTAAGKNRIVPVHPRIQPLVQNLMSRDGEYIFGSKISYDTYRNMWDGIMKSISADKTPHEARHTFETMLDNAGGNRKCIDMLMGHASKDVGNRVYNHKTLDQLRETINLLR